MEWLTLAAAKAFIKRAWPLLLLILFGLLVVGALMIQTSRERAAFKAGEAARQALWDESIERGKRELARREAARAKITVKTETVYVDRIRVVRGKGQTLIQRIPAMVPADACLLPAGFRLSHDHAAAGTVPDAANRVDAGAAAAESIAWRPWDSSAGAAGRVDRRRQLQPVSPARRTAARLAGVDSRAGGR